ncbi:MAG: YkgJ family cysteine cluster protein [Nitrospirae bacterium]|nr:YkgJ family cysteine cluster protein [Nitrospirota bacterium]
MLLDAYAIIDKGVSIAVREHEKEYKSKLACKKGCGHCCRTHSDIPLYPLEMVGIYWYSIEKSGRPLRGIIKKQLLEYRKGDPCPFQVDNACAIHTVRPLACRQFNVFSRPCSEGEDPYYTRRIDVLTPIEKYTHEAIKMMLPFYGITDESAKVQAVKTGFIHTQVQVLQACKWEELALRIGE